MDPTSDPSLHSYHSPHLSQRHQGLGSSQPSGSMSSSQSSSHAQGPASPPASTAASSNPFVRSHHQEAPPPRSDSQQNQQPRAPGSTDWSSMSRTTSTSSLSGNDKISVSIKCPSLDHDSAVLRVRPSDTVLALKHIIEHTWPGAPRADGMRFIRAGRILSDDEIFGQLVENLEQGEPLSLHLVIRPDAWSDPQNRPTPSRRSSYHRQQQQQQQQSLLRAALATSVPTASGGQSVGEGPSTSSETPRFEPYFSEPLASADSYHTETGVTPDVDMLGSSSAFYASNGAGSGDLADSGAVLEDILRVTAPENWPTLIEALRAARDEYIVMYEAIYNDAQAAQKAASTSNTTSASYSQSELLTSVEATLLGWDPVPMPGAEPAISADLGQEKQYVYRQITHRGLPYLLRLSTTPLDLQRSEALHTLLQRISSLGSMIDKLENIIALGSLLYSSNRPISAFPAAPHPAFAQAPPLAAGQGVAPPSLLGEAIRQTRETLGSITFADVTAVAMPMFFLGMKVGILLSVMLRGADRRKRYFLLGMAVVYVLFEGYRIVQRRIRVRRRVMARREPPIPRAAPAPAADAREGNPDRPVAGANVPSAPSHEEAAESPLQPLPPPQAPRRFGAQRRFTLDWVIDHMAFIGLDIEDAELGLTRSPDTPGRNRPQPPNVTQRVLASTWVLPVVLFFFTMVPQVEQRRKRAIEERERVIRKWTRLEHERRQRAQELLEKQRQEGEQIPDSVGEGVGVGEVQSKREEYVDRMLRQRRNTEAAGMDEADEIALAAGEEDEDDEFGEEMNIF